MIDGPFATPLVKLNELCERAVRFRRSQITDPLLSAGDLRHGIRFSLPRRDLTRDPDGWVHISNLIDRIEFVEAKIKWLPETDQVRLVYPPPLPPQWPEAPN